MLGLHRLERGDVHLTMTAAGVTRFRERLLYPMHVMAALSPAHRLGRRAVLEIAELADEPLLLLRHGFGSREWFDIACEIAHIRPPVLLESAAPHTLIALAATDYAVAILPSNAQVPRGIVRPSAGSPRGVDRQVGAHRVGSATVPGAVCRAVRRGARGPLPAKLSGA